MALCISTHTPLAGRDITYLRLTICSMNFYSHAPRGARRKQRGEVSDTDDFYSHAPRGARPVRPVQDLTGFFISTHTPLAGRDEMLGDAPLNTE